MQDLNNPVVGVVDKDVKITESSSLPKSPTLKKGAKSRKIIISLAIVLILALGIVAGIFLVQRSQDIREKAANYGGSDCGQSLDCFKIDTPQSSGSYTVERLVDYVIVKAGTEPYKFPGDTRGCFSVTIDQKTVTWEKTGPSPECKGISHIEIWMFPGGVLPTLPNPTATLTPDPTATIVPGRPTATPIPNSPTATLVPNPSLTPTDSPSPSPTGILPFIASCNGLFTYDTNWNLLTSDDLSALVIGDVVRFATSATVNQGLVTKAKFVINGVDQPETILKKSGSDLFYYDYTIPEGTTTFSVKALLYHSTQGWF